MKALCPENYNSKDLAEAWGDYIDWEKRRKGENGWLGKTLINHDCKRVLDTCVGDGADLIYLAKNGFKVHGNEFDPVFYKKAEENLKSVKMNLKVSSQEWRNLKKDYEPESFCAVLCLGNSLTYLFTRSAQLQTLNSFRNLMKEGGILIIDERNYQQTLDLKNNILDKRLKHSGMYYYCGKKFKLKPHFISNNKIIMDLIKEDGRKIITFTVYPFKKDELLGLLEEVGFKKIEQYSDFKKGYNPSADFYQYVCVK